MDMLRIENERLKNRNRVLERENALLRTKILRMEIKLSDYSWETNPDRGYLFSMW